MKQKRVYLVSLAAIFIIAATLCVTLAWSNNNEGEGTLKITPSGSSGIVLKNETAEFTFEIPADKVNADGTALSVDIESDLGEKKHYSFPIDAKAGEAFKKTVPVTASEPGYWEAKASVMKKNDELSSAVSGLSVVDAPNDYGKIDTSSFFGMVNVADFAAADKMGVKFNRTPIIWSAAEPQQGQYSWDGIDKKIEEGRQHGVSTVLTIVTKTLMTANKVPWAKWKDENDLVSGTNIEYYRTFVTAVVNRYKDKVAAFELTNEPDVAIYKNEQASDPSFGEKEGSIATWKLHTEAYKIIKELAPNTPVVGMDISGADFRNGMPFYKSVMNNGAQGVLDVFGGHAYTMNRSIGGDKDIDFPNDYDLRGIVEKGLDVTSSFGLKRRFWGTELGWMYKDGMGPLSAEGREFAAVTAQALITVKSVPGAEKLMWFVFTFNNNVGPGKLYNYSIVNGKTGSPFPYMPVNAYSTAAKILGQTKPSGVLNMDRNITAYSFTSLDEKRSVVTLWSNSNKTYKLSFPAVNSLDVFDFFGREKAKGATIPISREPTYYVVSSENLSALESSLKSMK